MGKLLTVTKRIDLKLGEIIELQSTRSKAGHVAFAVEGGNGDEESVTLRLSKKTAQALAKALTSLTKGSRKVTSK